MGQPEYFTLDGVIHSVKRSDDRDMSGASTTVT